MSDTPAPSHSPLAVAEMNVFISRLYRARYLIVLGALLGAAAGLAVALLTPTTFRASTTMIIRQTSAPSPAVAANSMRAVIANHRVAAAVIKELSLPLTPAGFISRQLEIADVPGTYLIRISVRLADGELAARAANAVAREAIALNAALNRTGGEKLERVLQDELGAARKRMTEAEGRLTESRTRLRSSPSPPPLHVAEIESGRLHAEYDLATRLYEEIAVQFGKLRLQVAQQTYELLVVEDAIAPEGPVSARPVVTAVFGAVTGTTLALVICLLFAALAPAGDVRR